MAYDPFVNSTNSSSFFTLTVSSELNKMSIIELSSNIGYTSVLNMTRQNFDIYDIRPTNTVNDILIIELSNCIGNIKYKLSETITKEGNSKEEESSYTINNYKGKKVLTTSVNAGANHYLKVYVDPIEIQNNLTEITYMVRYYSGKSADMLSYYPDKRGIY